MRTAAERFMSETDRTFYRLLHAGAIPCKRVARCHCGSDRLSFDGQRQRYTCGECGAESAPAQLNWIAVQWRGPWGLANERDAL